MEGDRLATAVAERIADHPITFAPIAVQPYSVLSRANTVDSCASASNLSSDLFARQSESRLSTRSALSALLAAADQGSHIRRTGSSEFGGSDASGAEIANDSQDQHSDDVHIASSNGTTNNFSKDAPAGDSVSKRSANGSHGNLHSKSNSRSNSISQLSLHSTSDGSIQRERSSRLAEDDGPTSFAENLRCDSHASHSPSAHYHQLLAQHRSQSPPTNNQHSLASESARRILASNSFDSDLSDGGMGDGYAPHPHHDQRHDRDLSFSHDRVHNTIHRHIRDQEDFVCSEDEYPDEEEDEEVAEFDEFADFNAFDASLNRSSSSAGGGINASVDTWDDDEYARGRSSSLLDAAPACTHELTCKQLMLLILSAEVVFEAPTKRSPKSPAIKPTVSTMAAKLLRGSLGITVQADRTGSDNSIELPKSVLQRNVANAGATGSPKKRRSPLKTSGSPRANSFGLNLSGNSLGSGSPRNSSSTGTGTGSGAMKGGRSADDLAVAEAERLVRQRLCVYPAEDDGTPMDDLPEYSIATNVLRSGLEDFALMDKLTKKCLYQIKLEGRPADFDMYDADEFAAESAGEANHIPSPPAISTAVVQGTTGDAPRAMVGTTVEVLRYDATDAALNPVTGLGPEPTLITTLDRMTSDSTRSSDSETSSGKEGDLRAKFSRARSDSNNDTIRMFRTETDEMLQSKIEEALAAERAAAEAAGGAAGGAASEKPKEKKKDRAPKITVPIEDKNTKYITVTGRRDESAEFKALLRIPLFDGKPYVTMPSLKPPSPDAGPGKNNPYTPNSRDIAIATPTKPAPDKNPMSPLGNRAQARAPSYYPDKDAQVSAALRALQNGGAVGGGGVVLQTTDYMSDTEVDFRHHSRNGTPNREAAVNRRSLNVFEQQQRTTPAHQRNRTFDFAQFSVGTGAGVFEVPVPLTPKGGAHTAADAEWHTAAGPSTGPGAPGSRLRNPSFDSVGGAELPSGYVLNPHTSNRDISFFAIHSGSTPLGTPSATPKKMLSKSNSNSNSNSNLAGLLAESMAQSQNGGAESSYNLGVGVAASGSNDVIQLSRRSRSNSILSQSDYNPGVATQRSSFSSEVSESNHSALHQQLQQAGVLPHNGGSRSSSRGGSVNFFTSANLGGGGFSSDDCSDGGSSSDSEDEFGPRAPASVDGSPKYDSYGRIRRGKHLSALHTAHDEDGWRRSASASSGSRTPTKKASPIHSAGHSRGSSFGNNDHLTSNLTSNLAGKTASSTLTTTSGSSTSISASASGSGEDAAESGSSAIPVEDTNASDVRPPAERSSFYFLSRLFGTFRRSTASNATPRGSAVKIAIIHEAEDEDSDASSSPGSSRKASPSP